MKSGDTGLDSGAAVYADIPLDYLDTGRGQPIVTAHYSSGRLPVSAVGWCTDQPDAGLEAAFDGAFAVLIELDEGERTRRRLVMSLAAAERARQRAEDRGQRCRVALVRLDVVAELDDEPRDGGDR